MHLVDILPGGTVNLACYNCTQSLMDLDYKFRIPCTSVQSLHPISEIRIIRWNMEW